MVARRGKPRRRTRLWARIEKIEAATGMSTQKISDELMIRRTTLYAYANGAAQAYEPFLMRLAFLEDKYLGGAGLSEVQTD